MGERILPQTSTQFAGTRQPRISLVDRDFAAIRRALLDLIRIRFPNEFKDFETSGIGMAIIEVVAYSHAQIGYYVDAHANEFFIPTARTFSGMRRLTAALNYRMRTATAAGVALTAFPQPPQPSKVRLDAGTTFRAKNGTIWELLNDTIIAENAAIFPDPESGSTDLILAAEGEPKTSRFTSDGSEFQKFLIPDENVIEGSIRVSIANKEWLETDSLIFSEGFGFAVDRTFSNGLAGFSYVLTRLYPRSDNFNVTLGSDPSTAETWEQVEDFLSSSPSDPHYILSVDPTTGFSTVLFGDGVNGRIPDSEELLVFTYNVIGPQEQYQIVLEPDGLLSIRFGNGKGAVIPPANEEILVEFKVGGGLRGNIDIGGIDARVQGIIVATGDPVEVRLQNQEAGAGAEDPETVDHARLFAPKVAASTGRASTQNDYDGLLNSFAHPEFGSPAFGKADLHSDFPESNQVDIILWTRDAEGRIFPAPPSFREVVKVFIESRNDICHLIAHKGGDTVYVDLFTDVAIKSTLDVSSIIAQVRQAVLDYFLSTQVLPGVDIHLSQLIAVMQSIPGVDYLEVTRIRLSRRQRFVYFIGNGSKDRFRTESFFGYDPDVGAPVIPGTFQLLVNDLGVTDDLQGNLVGDTGTAGSANIITYDDLFQERFDSVTQGPRFFTPFFLYKRFVINELPQTVITSELLPDSDFTTIGGTLVVTDGVQYAYDDGVPSGFSGDVVGPGSIIDVGGQAEISLEFSSPATGPIIAYYLAAIPSVEFNGDPPLPTVDQQQIEPLSHPVRPSTVAIRHNQDLVVDDGLGNFVWGQNETDTRDEANSIIYKDEVVEDEDLSIHEVPLSGGLKYQGRLRDVPQVPSLSPQIRPSNVLVTDGFSEVQDDGLGNFEGGLLDTNSFNRIFYEDTDIAQEIFAVAGQAVYTGVPILPGVKLPPVHGATPPHFEIVTQVQDPGDSLFYTVILRDVSPTGTGVLSEVAGPVGPSGPYLISGTVNYDSATLSLELKYASTLPIRCSFTVVGGTFVLNLTAAFSTTPKATYRKALGGQLDITYPGTNVALLQLRYDQATGGQFDAGLSSPPGVGDLLQIDYRFRFEQDVLSDPIFPVTTAGTRRVRGQLSSRPLRRGSLIVTATDSTGQTLVARDDGGGVFVGTDVNSTGGVPNFVDYDTGAIDFSFVSNLLVGSEVIAQYTAFLEPDDVVPILDDQMADIGALELTAIDPVDIN